MIIMLKWKKISRNGLVSCKLDCYLLMLQLGNFIKKNSIFQFESFIIVILTIIQGGNYSSEETIQGRKLLIIRRF